MIIYSIYIQRKEIIFAKNFVSIINLFLCLYFFLSLRYNQNLKLIVLCNWFSVVYDGIKTVIYLQFSNINTNIIPERIIPDKSRLLLDFVRLLSIEFILFWMRPKRVNPIRDEVCAVIKKKYI